MFFNNLVVIVTAAEFMQNLVILEKYIIIGPCFVKFSLLFFNLVQPKKIDSPYLKILIPRNVASFSSPDLTVAWVFQSNPETFFWGKRSNTSLDF